MSRKGGTPENLIPYKPGETGNPNGRPPVLPELKELLTKILSEEITDTSSKKKVIALDAVLLTLRNKALKGDMRAIQEVLDRFYGKPNQGIDVKLDGPTDSELLKQAKQRAIDIADEKD